MQGLTPAAAQVLGDSQLLAGPSVWWGHVSHMTIPRGRRIALAEAAFGGHLVFTQVYYVV